MKNYFDHLALTVKDVKVSKNFYKEAFGFETIVERSFPTAGLLACFVGIPDDSAGLQLNVYDEPRESHPEESHYAIRTDCIEDLRKFHVELGFNPTPMLDAPHQKCYFLSDPDGYQIEVIQPK